MREKQIEEIIENFPESVENGLRVIKRQKRTSLGIIDLFCKDKKDNYVIVEIKKNPTTKVIAQLAKYNMALIKEGISKDKLRTILVVQEATDTIKEICNFFKFELKNLNPNKKIKKTKNRKFSYKEGNLAIFFMKNKFIKVMDFLIENYLFDYTKTEVAREVGISRMTIEHIWNYLIKKRMIIRRKKIGNAILYRLNTENIIVKKLRELDLLLTKVNYEKSKIVIPA